MKALFLRALGWAAVLPYLLVLALVLTGPATWSGVLYVLALGAIVIGLVSMPVGGQARRWRPRGITRAGAASIALVASVRCCTASSGTRLHVTTAGGGSGARLSGRIVDEGDVAVAGTRVLAGTSFLRLVRDDAAELPSSMRAAYDDMHAAEGDAPSALLPTYLGLQRPGAFDLVVVEPPDAAARSDLAIVFVHGFAGNFDLPCWQVARAVRQLGIVTACPSTRFVGDWWSADGEATVRETIELLRARGLKRFVLVGLSNGGIGASRLAPRMKGTFVGLILISGVAADAPPAGVPTLVIHGRSDTMASPLTARAYAERASARLVLLDAGHFAMLVRAEESERAIAEHVSGRAGRVARSIATP